MLVQILSEVRRGEAVQVVGQVPEVPRVGVGEHTRRRYNDVLAEDSLGRSSKEGEAGVLRRGDGCGLEPTLFSDCNGDVTGRGVFDVLAKEGGGVVQLGDQGLKDSFVVCQGVLDVGLESDTVVDLG